MSFSITLSVPAGEREFVIAELWELGTTGIAEDDDWVRAFFDAADIDELTGRFAAYAPRVEADEERDWVAHSRSLWKPFAVGDRWFLVPEWTDTPAPPGRLRLAIRPGMACGSGWHPATQLSLMSLERAGVPGASVLDVGTGSGILAEAALLLGARSVVGCDIDDEATRVAAGNVAGPAWFTGSLRSVRAGAVDVVVANLNAATIATLAQELVRVARGIIALSGFREWESERVAGAIGRPVREHFEQEDWKCLIF